MMAETVTPDTFNQPYHELSNMNSIPYSSDY